MAAYEDAREAVVLALGPVVDYCQRMHETGDASDKAQAGRFAHVTRLEALTAAVIEYGAAAEAIHQAYEGSARIRNFCERIRQTPAYLNALDRPEHLRHLAGTISSYCLPVPIYAQLQPV